MLVGYNISSRFSERPSYSNNVETDGAFHLKFSFMGQ